MVSFHGVERTEAPSGEFTGLVKTEPELVLLITKNRIIAFDSGEKKSLPLPRSKGMVPCNPKPQDSQSRFHALKSDDYPLKCHSESPVPSLSYADPGFFLPTRSLPLALFA